MGKKTSDETNPSFKLKNSIIITIYIELLILLLFCCFNNTIIKSKSGEIMEELKISKKDTNNFGMIRESGRAVGALFMIFYFLTFGNYNDTIYLIFFSILFKSIMLLVYCLNLKKEECTLYFIMGSIFLQGLFHSFIDIYFPIWINHFMFGKYKLLLLSFSMGVSPFSNSIGYIFKIKKINSLSFKESFAFLFIIIFVLDLIFLIKIKCCFHDENNESSDNYFNLLLSKEEEEDVDGYGYFNLTNDKYKKKKNCKSLFCPKNSCAFYSITFVRSILKFIYVGINYLYKDFYQSLEGDEKFGTFINIVFSLFPLIGLIIGGLLLSIESLRKKKFFLIPFFSIFIICMSIIIEAIGIMAYFSGNKCSFNLLLNLFKLMSNIIMPLIIQKSFDCTDESEIHYFLNCLLSIIFGNFFSSIFTNIGMAVYLIYAGLFNIFLIFIYECIMYSKNEEKPNINEKNDKGTELVKVKDYS